MPTVNDDNPRYGSACEAHFSWAKSFRMSGKLVAAALAVLVVGSAISVLPVSSASATDTILPSPNGAAKFIQNVPGSVLEAAGPTSIDGAELSAGQLFDLQWLDSGLNAYSGSLTDSPVAESSLGSSAEATVAPLEETFTAPAVEATAVTKVIGGSSVAFLGFSAVSKSAQPVRAFLGFRTTRSAANRMTR